MSTIHLCGAGNPDGIRLVRHVNAAQHRWDRIALLDDDPAWHGRSRLGVPVEGPLHRLVGGPDVQAQAVNLIARSTRTRWRVRQRLLEMGVNLPAIIHPQVDVGDARLTDDLIVYERAVIGAEAHLGEGVVIFSGSIVGHECVVGDGCVIASGAVLNARVKLGRGVYVGANATVLPEVEIGAWATIGAGSSVVADVPPGATALGVPAQNICPPAAGRPHFAPTSLRPADGTGARDDIERTLIAIWSDSLGIDDVDTHGTFFDLGGTSLTAIRISQQISQAMGRKVRITDLYRFPTIHELARHLAQDGCGDDAHWPPEGLFAAMSDAERRIEVRRAVMRRRMVHSPVRTVDPFPSTW